MKKIEIEFRPTALDERKEFYEHEFDIEKVKRWFMKNTMQLPQLCSVDAGTETGIIIDRKFKGQMLYFPFRELKKKIKKYIPEDVYYDRNVYTNPDTILKNLKFNNFIEQELVFDIDADNIDCKCSKGTELCGKCLKVIFSGAKKMKEALERDFKKVKLVYSGRGFHVHVLDRKAFLFNVKEREKLNKKFSKYPIDPWVSRGYIHLIRMPYSLNGLVSRKVMPIKDNLEFNREKTYPKFLI